MTIDDERRYVARKLRIGGNPSLMKLMAYMQCGEDEIFERLADLIEPSFPDASASCDGWRVDVYDPDGTLVSPSLTAEGVARAMASGVDRGALLRLADRMDEMAGKGCALTPQGIEEAADRIRETLGERDGSR